MRIFKTIIALLFIQSALQAQTIPDAKKAIEAEFYYKAKKILLGLNAATPTVESNYYLGNVYSITGNIDSAKFYYKKASEIVESKNALIYIAMGKLNLLNNNKTEAAANFASAIKVNKGKSAEVYYQIGEAYLGIDNNEAIKNFEIAYAADPALVINLLAYGDAYEGMGDPSKAMTKYEQARSINNNIAVTHLRIARMHSKTGKHAEAIESYLKTVELDPTIAIAWKELGEEYYLDRQYEKVKPCFDKYSELNREDKASRIVPAVTCFQIGDYSCAIEVTQKIIADEPNNFLAWRILYWSQYELGDSLRKLDAPKSAQLFVDGFASSQSYWNLTDKKVIGLDYPYSARLAVEVKDTAKAMFYYNLALSNDTTGTYEVYSEYAKYLYNMKKYADAISAYTGLASKFDEGVLDIYFLGRSYFQVGDYVNADTTFAQFIVLQPNSADGYLQRAKTQVRAEGTDVKGGALPYYLKFIELGEKDLERNKKTLIDAYLYCCVYYNSIDNNTDACTFLAKAKALDAENALLKELEPVIKCQ
jgi:tetratricopeptide (TPR) repeat protein